MNELHWLGAVELAQQISAKRLSPIEIIQAYLRRIELLDGHLKSYLIVFAESSQEAARVAEAAVMKGDSLGPLHGVPVAVKDVFEVKGTPTTAGSRFLTDPAARDSTVVARLRAAGAIILGKLNLQEFAYGAEGTNSHYGTPWNPWDAKTNRLPGGSSSGSAVAVAAGLAPVGMGSDTGGSIRMPAACCGAVGLKPTYGRVSRAGIIPLAWSLDHVGPLTRSVEDAASVLAVVAGYDPRDPSSSSLPVPDYMAGLGTSVRGLRIGLFREYVEQAGREVRAAIALAVQTFEELGCAIEDVDIPTAHYARGASQAILAPEAIAYHYSLLRRHATEYSPEIRQRILVGGFLSATDYLKGQRARQLLRADVSTSLRRADCLLVPSIPIPAPAVADTEVRINDQPVAPRWALSMFTSLFNVTGHPAIAIPCGFSEEGLPLSLQLIGRQFDEVTILRVGHAYERATRWHTRRPPTV